MTEQYTSRRERIAAERRAQELSGDAGQSSRMDMPVHGPTSAQPFEQLVSESADELPRSTFDPMLSESEEPLTSQHQVIQTLPTPAVEALEEEQIEASDPEITRDLDTSQWGSSDFKVSFETNLIDTVAEPPQVASSESSLPPSKRAFEYEQFFDSLEVKPNGGQLRRRPKGALIISVVTFSVAALIVAGYLLGLIK